MSQKTELEELMAQAGAEAEEAFDLSDVEEVSIGALPPGEYLCVVSDAKQELVKSGENKGAPKFALRFKPVSPASNKLIFKHALLSGKAAGVTKSLLKTLGVDVSQPVRVSTLAGRHIYLTLSQREDRPGDNDIVSWRAYDENAEDAEDLSELA